MVDRILHHLGKLAILSVIFTVSVSSAGFFYVWEFAYTLGYNTSLFDQDFYTFLKVVLVSDVLGVMLNTILYFLCFFIFIVIYPNSLVFVFDILSFFVLLLWNYLGINLLKFLYSLENVRHITIFLTIYSSPFIIFLMISLTNLLLIPFCIGFVFYKILERISRKEKFKKYLTDARASLEEHPSYKKIETRMNQAGNDFFQIDFFKGSMVLFCGLIILILWGKWVFDIGLKGGIHANEYLYQNSNYDKTVYLMDKTNFKAIFISKVENGYLFVPEEKNECKGNRIATLIPDSFIQRIE